METPAYYIPMDRRQALAAGQELPEYTQGAALFADISGFTPLTEALAHTFGAHRGAEELTIHLNNVYDALITELHNYHGSVIGFSGDAMTCWFDQDTGLQATACALAMQAAMLRFQTVTIKPGQTVSLAMKAAVAAGQVRRFLVGDPTIQVVEVIAGATLDRLAATEHHTEKGEVVVDRKTAQQLGAGIRLSSWREGENSEEGYGLVEQLETHIAQHPWPEIASNQLTPQQSRPWLLPAVYSRLESGLGDFLAELRPVTALFTYFTGINYDNDEAANLKLDGFIREVQRILQRYEGNLIQLTIGDKGSYLYAAFGAPQAHEDDPVRAVSAALELNELAGRLDYITSLRIGITRGFMRTGSYGGNSQRTYGVMGDSTNLAARLMQAASPGQILTDGVVYRASEGTFHYDNLGEIRVKGKANPVKIFSPVSRKERGSVHLQEPRYALPMVGRLEELEEIRGKIELALRGQGQVVGITAEAGMGKSRLLAEALRTSRAKEFTGYSGESQSYGTNNSYLPWQSIWQSFFQIDPNRSIEENLNILHVQLGAASPNLLLRMPLLSAVLKISLPDNDLTGSLDAKLRKSSLEGLLVEYLRIRAKEHPLLFILEDCHWMDPLSQDLVESLGRTISDLPVVIFMTYRPPEEKDILYSRLARLPHFSEICLGDFTPDEARQLIGIKLTQSFGTDTQVPAELVSRIIRQAEGNPFYIEELLNYLNDRGIRPDDNQAISNLELPDSLHKLILTRIDQVTESQKTTLKIASVIGRLFKTNMLWGVYPTLGTLERVKSDLDVLAKAELINQDSPEPELAYLFKHVVTQEVTYDSLPFATRARLHEQVGLYIETANQGNTQALVDLLAYHYERSNNIEKKSTYLQLAGEAAQAEYANEAAIGYYQKVLPLLRLGEQIRIYRKLGDVLVLIGRWEQAKESFQAALRAAEEANDPAAQAWCRLSLGEFFRKKGQFQEATQYLTQARQEFDRLEDIQGTGQVLHYWGTMAAQQGDYDAARTNYEASLEIRRQLDDKPNIAALLSNMGIVARFQGDSTQAKVLFEESLATRREIGNRWAVAVSLNNLGNATLDLGDGIQARAYLEEAIKLYKEVGDRWYVANSLNNLANVERNLVNLISASRLYLESLQINSELGDGWALAYLLEDIGVCASQLGEDWNGLQLLGAAASLRESIHSPLSPAEEKKLDRQMEHAHQVLSAAEQDEAWEQGRKLSLDQAIELAIGFLNQANRSTEMA